MSQYVTHGGCKGGCGCKGGGLCNPMGSLGHDGLSGVLEGVGKGYIVLGLAALALFLYSHRGANR